MAGERVCLGVVAGAHGVRGLVRVKSFTDRPDDIAAYGPVTDDSGGRRFHLTVVGHLKAAVLVRVEGITGRDQAEALSGARFYVYRDALPELEGEEEFYYADLVGLAAEDIEGKRLGRVKAVHNFGAGDMLELDDEGDALLYPFTRAVVRVVDLTGGRIVIDPPCELAAEAADHDAG
jgi:16S rRNA processing protein RimM